MPRFLIPLLRWAASVALFVGVAAVLPAQTKPPAPAHASRPSETLLPNTTQGFIAIANVDTLGEHWNKTQLGHLMADPVMEPFTTNIRRQFEDRWSSIHERFGITLEDMRGVPGGEAAMGLIAPQPGTAAVAILVDAAGKLPQARELIEKAAKTQSQRGAKRSERKVEGCEDTVLQFDLPEPEEEKEAAKAGPDGRSDGKVPAAAPPQSPTRQAFYCLAGNLLVMADDPGVMTGILRRWVGLQKGDSLADHPPFQAVVRRCRDDYSQSTPQIRWFIHPLGYAEAARAATPEGKRRKGKSILEVLRNQGIAGVQGIGGLADFAAEGHELIHRTAIYAPPPCKKSMKMAVLPNRADFTPQPWVPRDVATYTTFYFDILNAFDNFGSLFDELFGQGATGVWADTIESLKNDPNGPQIDLRKELIQPLGQRVSVLTDYQLPITTASERLLFAIEVKNSKAVAAALEKLFKNDPTVKRRILDGLTVWEFVEDETPEVKPPDIEGFGDVPVPPPPHGHKKKKKGGDEEEEERQRLLPHAAVTVWQGHLMIASHKDFLLKVIAPAAKPKLLSDDADFRLVHDDLETFQPKQKCFRFFSRTDEEYRPTYELIRQNKMPESESLFARLLNVLFGEGKKGATRTQQIDGSKLPDYDVVRRFLGPAGMQVTSEPKGWFFKGFTLTKQNPSLPEKAQSGGPVQPSAPAKPSKPVKPPKAIETPKSTEPTKPAAPAEPQPGEPKEDDEGAES